MVLQAIASRLPPPDALYELLAADEGTLLAQGLLGVGQSILTMLGGFVVVLALSIYWSTDRLRFERLWLTLVTASKRAEARRIWRNVEEGVGGYLRSAVVQSYAAALLLGLGYLLIGLPFPTLLAIVAALAWLIPLLGFVAAVVLAFLAGLSEGILVALFVALYTAGLFLLLRRLAGPRLAEWRDLHSSLLAVVMMIVLAEAYGLAGLLLAWPLAVAVETLVIELMRQRRSRLEAGSPPGRIAELENRLRQIQAQLASDADSPSPELASLAERTAALVEEAKVSLESGSGDAATPS
jgi:predicted PurR-regulated permease PerM